MIAPMKRVILFAAGVQVVAAQWAARGAGRRQAMMAWKRWRADRGLASMKASSAESVGDLGLWQLPKLMI